MMQVIFIKCDVRINLPSELLRNYTVNFMRTNINKSEKENVYGISFEAINKPFKGSKVLSTNDYSFDGLALTAEEKIAMKRELEEEFEIYYGG